jgi:hypothetical protein
MPTYTDGIKRNRPRINVPLGYFGNETKAITRTAPLDGDPTDGVTNGSLDQTVFSGQPVILDANGLFTFATVTATGALKAGYDPSKVYFAFHDSTDPDVASCGKLMGFAAIGNFSIETAWCDLTDLAVGDPIGLKVYDGTDGHRLGKVANKADRVGWVTEIRDLGIGGHTSINSLISGATGLDGNGIPEGVQRGGNIGVDSNGDPIGTIPEDSTAISLDYGGSRDGIWVVKFTTNIA